MIYLGADHGGLEYKEKLEEYLKNRGYTVTDAGANKLDPDDDYPLIAQKVAKLVAEDPNNRGILLCRSGAGVCMVANKFKKIRAAQAWNKETATAARKDDSANVLCVAADYDSFDEVKEMAKAFLDTSFSGEERFKRRIKEIEEIEKQN